MQDSSIFYHLPQVSSQSQGIDWIVAPRLKRYIDRFADADVDIIAYHLVTTAPQPDSNACLTALLAHIAFIPAHRLRSTHALLQQHYTEDLTDLYQIGLEILSDARGFLSNFDASRAVAAGYWYPNFYRWCQHKFDRMLTDKIRNQKGMSSFNRSNFSLVARATAKKVVKALIAQGYPVATHGIYLALHDCLTVAIKAKRFNSVQPQAADYDAIFALYCQCEATQIDRTQIVSYLDRLGTAMRNYDRLYTQSGDVPKWENDDRTIFDTISDREDPMDKVIVAEYRQEVDRVKQIVIDLLTGLAIASDRLLLLLYGLNLNQKDTGKELSCNQTTVMRRAEKILASLAADIYDRTSQKSPPLSSEQLRQIIIHSIELCRQYYPDLLDRILAQIVSRDLVVLIDRVQLRWEIQFQIGGAAIEKLSQWKVRNE